MKGKLVLGRDRPKPLEFPLREIAQELAGPDGSTAQIQQGAYNLFSNQVVPSITDALDSTDDAMVLLQIGEELVGPVGEESHFSSEQRETIALLMDDFVRFATRRELFPGWEFKTDFGVIALGRCYQHVCDTQPVEEQQIQIT